MLSAGDRVEHQALRDYFGRAIWGDVRRTQTTVEIQFSLPPSAPPPAIDGVMGDILAWAPDAATPPLYGDLLLFDDGGAVFIIDRNAPDLPDDLSQYHWEYSRLERLSRGVVKHYRNGAVRDPDSFWLLDIRKDASA